MASNGENLWIRHPQYRRDPVFAAKMGRAVNGIVERWLVIPRGAFTPEMVRDALVQELIPARIEVELFYREADRPFEPAVRIRASRRSLFARPTDGDEKRRQVDKIPETNDRARSLRGRALALAHARTGFSTYLSDRDEEPLSAWDLEADVPVCTHPDPKRLPRIQREAYAEIARVLNTTQMTTEEIEQCLGRAHYLLIQAPPTRRGSATYAHALVDAARRVALGSGFPNLRDGVQLDYEPLFWPENAYVRRFAGSVFFEAAIRVGDERDSR